MSESSYEERRDSAVEDFQKQLDEIRATAEAEREAAKADEGETEEEYYDRVRNVPGIFGDIDTTAGVSASGTDVVSAQNEVATQFAAAVEAKADEGDEEAEDMTYGEARRQADVSSDAVPSAEEVDAGAPDREEGEEVGGSQEERKEEGDTSGNTEASESLGSEDDDAKKSSRRGKRS